MKHCWLSVVGERNRRKKGIIYFTGRRWLTTQVKGWTTTDFSPSLHPHFIPFHPPTSSQTHLQYYSKLKIHISHTYKSAPKTA